MHDTTGGWWNFAHRQLTIGIAGLVGLAVVWSFLLWPNWPTAGASNSSAWPSSQVASNEIGLAHPAGVATYAAASERGLAEVRSALWDALPSVLLFGLLAGIAVETMLWSRGTGPVSAPISELRLGLWVGAFVAIAATVLVGLGYPSVPCHSAACRTLGDSTWQNLLFGWSRDWFVGPVAMLVGAACGGGAGLWYRYTSETPVRASGMLGHH